MIVKGGFKALNALPPLLTPLHILLLLLLLLLLLHQLVLYPLIDLSCHYKEDLHWYLRALEETVITTLGKLGIEGGREEGLTGVWVEGAKVAVSRG